MALGLGEGGTRGQVRKGAAAPEHCTLVPPPPSLSPAPSMLNALQRAYLAACEYWGLLRHPQYGTWDMGHVTASVTSVAKRCTCD